MVLLLQVDTEPYAKMRDSSVNKMAKEAGVEVKAMVSHTLYVSALHPFLSQFTVCASPG
jgi:hypothetical protein